MRLGNFIDLLNALANEVGDDAEIIVDASVLEIEMESANWTKTRRVERPSTVNGATILARPEDGERGKVAIKAESSAIPRRSVKV